MRKKNEKRILAEKLRKEAGLSYSDISKQTGVSKSTLSAWLKHIFLSEDQQEQLRKRMEENRATFAARAWSVNHERYLSAHRQAIQDGIDVFTQLPKLRSVDELSLAMLYLGEGSKGYGRVQIASTEAKILNYFLVMLMRLFPIKETRLSFRLNLVNAALSYEQDFISWWKNELHYPNARFIRTQYDPRSHKGSIDDNYHGVCTLTYYDTYLQQRILSLANAYIGELIGRL